MKRLHCSNRDTEIMCDRCDYVIGFDEAVYVLKIVEMSINYFAAYDCNFYRSATVCQI
jgi:hypothetical protein